MADRDQEVSRDKTSELRTELPFMEEFPFSDYEITMIERGETFISLGVSPILVNAFGENGTIDIINFQYIEDDSKVAISLPKYDVEFIADESTRIKKIDSLRKTLDDALIESNILTKVKAIKVSRKFTKSIKCDNITGLDFNELLLEFTKLHETVLSSKVKLGLQKLSEASLKSTEFSERQFKAVEAFLNFQIHYAKILLGIIIAAKIY
jgi:hypothetical protein